MNTKQIQNEMDIIASKEKTLQLRKAYKENYGNFEKQKEIRKESILLYNKMVKIGPIFEPQAISVMNCFKRDISKMTKELQIKVFQMAEEEARARKTPEQLEEERREDIRFKLQLSLDAYFSGVIETVPVIVEYLEQLVEDPKTEQIITKAIIENPEKMRIFDQSKEEILQEVEYIKNKREIEEEQKQLFENQEEKEYTLKGEKMTLKDIQEMENGDRLKKEFLEEIQNVEQGTKLLRDKIEEFLDLEYPEELREKLNEAKEIFKAHFGCKLFHFEESNEAKMEFQEELKEMLKKTQKIEQIFEEKEIIESVPKEIPKRTEENQREQLEDIYNNIMILKRNIKDCKKYRDSKDLKMKALAFYYQSTEIPAEDKESKQYMKKIKLCMTHIKKNIQTHQEYPKAENWNEIIGKLIQQPNNKWRIARALELMDKVEKRKQRQFVEIIQKNTDYIQESPKSLKNAIVEIEKNLSRDLNEEMKATVYAGCDEEEIKDMKKFYIRNIDNDIIFLLRDLRKVEEMKKNHDPQFKKEIYYMEENCLKNCKKMEENIEYIHNIEKIALEWNHIQTQKMNIEDVLNVAELKKNIIEQIEQIKKGNGIQLEFQNELQRIDLELRKLMEWEERRKVYVDQFEQEKTFENLPNFWVDALEVSTYPKSLIAEHKEEFECLREKNQAFHESRDRRLFQEILQEFKQILKKISNYKKILQRIPKSILLMELQTKQRRD